MVSIACQENITYQPKKSPRRYAARGRCSASSLGQTPTPLGKKLDPPLLMHTGKCTRSKPAVRQNQLPRQPYILTVDNSHGQPGQDCHVYSQASREVRGPQQQQQHSMLQHR